MGRRSVGGRLPGRRGPAPRWEAAQRLRFEVRPITRLPPSGAKIWRTPAAPGSRARDAVRSVSRGTIVRGAAGTGTGPSGSGRGVLHLVVDRDQLGDLVLLGPGGHHHLNRVARFVTEQGLPDGRGRRDSAQGRVRFLRGHDLVDDRLPVLGLAQAHRRAEAHLVPRDLVQVDEGEGGQAGVEVAQARLEEALTLLGRLVLGVLAQVAVLPGAENLLRKLHLQLVVESTDLLLEPLLDLVHYGRPRLCPPNPVILSRLPPPWPPPTRSSAAAVTPWCSGCAG